MYFSLLVGNTVVFGCIEIKYNPKTTAKNPTARRMTFCGFFV